MLSNEKPLFLDKAKEILALEKNLSVGTSARDMNNSLLNCPFCDSDWIEIVKILNKSKKNKFYVRCMNCGARTRNQNEIVDAVKLWNRRADNESVLNN